MKMSVTRDVALFFIAIFTATLFVAVKGQCNHANPCTFAGRGGDALVNPVEMVSSGGTLAITLDVQIADITIDWLTLHRRTFNGAIPGPTWRVKRGDTVTVTLNNGLMLPHKEQAQNQQRFPNSTNLHTHGLHISSQVPQDNVFVHVNPGGSTTYVYQIDAENPAGTYWYHPHLHGSTMLQVHSGMAGMIIVEDPSTGTAAPPAHLVAVSCPTNCAHDVQLLFQPILQYINNAGRGFANVQRTIEDHDSFRHSQYMTSSGQTLEEWLEDAANGVSHFTVNGQLFPTLSVTTGQTKRFRMVNAGGSSTLELQIVDDGTSTPSTGCIFREIAFDGVYLDMARSPALGKTLLVPSGKADWLVVCNVAGTYEVRSVTDTDDSMSMGGFQRHDDLMFKITATGATTSTTIQTTLPTRESFVDDFRGLTQDQVSGRFVVEANPGTKLNRELFSSNTDYRFKSELGTTQEWYLINTDTNLGHPIHIHVNHFQIISYNAYTGPIGATQGPNLVMYSQAGELCHFQSSSYVAGTTANIPPDALQYLGHDQRWAAGGAGTLGYVVAGDFRDVMIVPPLSNITIRFMAHKFLGEVVMHCHILTHEDTGMMMTTDIVNVGESLAANTLTGGAAPGQCAECDPFPFNQVSNCSNVTTVANVVSTSQSSSNDLYYLFFLLAIPVIVIVVVIVVSVTGSAGVGAATTAVGSAAAAGAAAGGGGAGGGAQGITNGGAVNSGYIPTSQANGFEVVQDGMHVESF